jgi:alpha-beta hydrolase superfamily lysophospholipase
MLLSRRRLLALAGATLAPAVGVASASTIRLATAGGRQSSVSVWHSRGRARGTILFSHGAASSPNKYPDLLDAWTRAGYEVWAPLHVDSIEHPDTARYAGFASWTARIEDMRALAQHVAARKVIAAGHSYGALVALTIGGVQAEQPAGVVGPLRIAKVQAVIAFSPPAPVPGLVTAAGYETLAVPALIQTGDRDNPPGTPADAWRLHLIPFEVAAAGGHRYALVLAGVDHYFGGAICKFDVPGPAQAAQLHTAAEISTVFLDAYGANQSRARKALTARLSDTGTVILRTQ